MYSIVPFAAALAGFASFANAGASGTGTTTRFWDCCKPSCSWPGISSAISNPVASCNIKDQPLTNANEASGCNGGDSYMCSDQTPWAIDDSLAYGFAAVNIAGQKQADWCCACYKLTFTSTAITGKTMIVQAVNTGGDLNNNQFDLAIPAGGVGIFNGCSAEWNAPAGGWGAQYGGIAAASSCATLPAALQPGCNFRFGWMMGADNPTVEFEQVACPAELTAKTGCSRSDDNTEPSAGSPPGTSPAAPPTTSSSRSSQTKPTTVASSPPQPNAGSPAAAAAQLQSTTTSPHPQTTTSPSSGPASTGVSTIWQQCAGLLWTGPRTCAKGLTCRYQNPWYSQCLP